MRNGTDSGKENEDDHEKSLENLGTFHLGKEKSGDGGILEYCSIILRGCNTEGSQELFLSLQNV